jgi:hypothetical protein
MPAPMLIVDEGKNATGTFRKADFSGAGQEDLW